MFVIAVKERNDLFGRKPIRVVPPEVLDAQSVGTILNTAMEIHKKNSEEIQYLYEYYRGNQPVLYRTKEVRADINNTVVENRAWELVQFKVGYEFSRPVQYTNAGLKEDAPINVLSRFARLDSKEAKDVELAECFYVCGTAYKMCLPNLSDSLDEAPYFTDVMDASETMVIYSNAVGKKPLLGGKAVKQDTIINGKKTEQFIYGFYSETQYFSYVSEKEIEDFTKETPIIEPNPLGMIPIIEYPLNSSRLGYVELCMHLFNAINTLESNRMDGVEQFIQSLLVFINCELPTDNDGKKYVPKSGDAIDVKGVSGLNPEVKYLAEQLSQEDTQVTKDNLLDAYYEVSGTPSRNDRSGGGDTGAAVILRDGWGAAEARAKTTEKSFRKSEYEYLKIVLHICRNTASVDIGDLTLADIAVDMARNRNDSMAIKATTMKLLLECGVNPEDVYETIELFSDPVSVWKKSKEYQESGKSEKWLKLLSIMLADGQVDVEWAVINNPYIEAKDKDELLQRLAIADLKKAGEIFIPAENNDNELSTA